MKVKVNRSPIYNLMVFFILLDCEFFYIFYIPVLGEDGASTSIVGVAAVALFINCILNKEIDKVLKPYRNFINFYIIVLSIFIAVMVIYSYNKYSQGATEYFNCIRAFLYLFLVSPIVYIIEKFGYEKFIQSIVRVVMLIIIIQVFVAIVYNFTGTLLLETVKFGIRSSRLRCASPAAFGIAISYIIYKIFEEHMQKKKIQWILIFAFIFFYMTYVCMTRMLIISVVVTFLVMFLLRPRPQTNQVIVWMIVVSLILIFVLSGGLTAVIESFSTDNDDTGNSTLARQMAREYFSTYTHDNPLFSMGFVCPTNNYFYQIFFGPTLTSCFDDLGIANMWYHFGISGVILAGILFIRLIYLFIKIYYFNRSKNRVFFAGTLAYLLVSQVSLGAFDEQRIFTLVCIWALFEHEAIKNERKFAKVPNLVFDHSKKSTASLDNTTDK